MAGRACESVFDAPIPLRLVPTPVLAVVSDTHGTDGHRLDGRTAEAVRRADAVVHAGDFTTAAVLDAFEDEADRLEAVYGNNDDAAIRDRLPAERVVAAGGLTLVVTHGDRRRGQGLALLGREHAADLVVFGHSHRPSYEDAGDVGLLNPGSHADPRQFRPAHAELEVVDGALSGTIYEPDGTVIEQFERSL